MFAGRFFSCLAVCALAGASLTAMAQDAPKDASPKDASKDMHEKPSQLARPNGQSAVDPQQAAQNTDSSTPGGEAATASGQQAQPASPVSADWTAPLQRYAGSFTVKNDGRPGETYRNDCQVVGKRFFNCEQIQNGETISLVVFVPGDEPGHFFVQHVLPSGTATGRGDLTIEGNRWIFNSDTTQTSGAINRDRLTINFAEKEDGTAHFFGERSDDGEHWMTTFSGTEKRQK